MLGVAAIAVTITIAITVAITVAVTVVHLGPRLGLRFRALSCLHPWSCRFATHWYEALLRARSNV
jgi:hypothetical protein